LISDLSYLTEYYQFVLTVAGETRCVRDKIPLIEGDCPAVSFRAPAFFRASSQPARRPR